MEEKLFHDGLKVQATSVLPQGEQDGFFLVRQFDIRDQLYGGITEPLLVKAVTLELENGESFRLVVKREKPVLMRGLEWALAGVLKRLVDENSELIRADECGRRFITYKDLADGFNTEFADEEAGEPGNLKARNVGLICRDSFGMPCHRTDEGWAIFLNEDKLAAMAEKFELGVEGRDTVSPGRDMTGQDVGIS